MKSAPSAAALTRGKEVALEPPNVSFRVAGLKIYVCVCSGSLYTAPTI